MNKIKKKIDIMNANTEESLKKRIQRQSRRDDDDFIPTENIQNQPNQQNQEQRRRSSRISANNRQDYAQLHEQGIDIRTRRLQTRSRSQNRINNRELERQLQIAETGETTEQRRLRLANLKKMRMLKKYLERQLKSENDAIKISTVVQMLNERLPVVFRNQYQENLKFHDQEVIGFLIDNIREFDDYLIEDDEMISLQRVDFEPLINKCHKTPHVIKLDFVECDICGAMELRKQSDNCTFCFNGKYVIPKVDDWPQEMMIWLRNMRRR